MPGLPKISDAECEVMKVVWENPSCTARQIVESLSGKRDWNPRTIKTLLSRLVKKGALSYEKDGNRYLYKRKYKRDEVVKRESQSFINRVYDGVALPMLAYFVKTAKLSPEEIQELKEILDRKAESKQT